MAKKYVANVALYGARVAVVPTTRAVYSILPPW
jgi:hypothetical protein